MKNQPSATVKPPSATLAVSQSLPLKEATAGPPSDHQRVSRLLAAFDASTLGEGDPVAGANVLVAMAVSLANIHRPGSCLVAKDGERLAVGTSLLVSGSLSADLVSERVLSGLAEHQNNLIAHLRDWTRRAEIEMAKSPNIRRFDPFEILEKGTSSVLLGLHNDAINSGFEAVHFCTALIASPKGHGKRDLHTRPVVYITATKPAELTKHLEHSHLGRPLIHVGIHDPAACSRFEDVCMAVMDGTLTVGALSETVRGFIIATDPFETLANIVRAGDGKGASWLTRMLWLTDGTAGPEPGDITAFKPVVKLDAIQARFEAAMDNAWVARLDYTKPAPEDVECNWPRLQSEWVAFLKRMEAELPGITGTARSLLATLVFGISKLVDVWDAGDKLERYTADIAALARWLIQRMANARAAMLHSEHQARIRRVAQALALKLADGPHTQRSLIRRCRNLLSADCLLALCLLQTQGVAERTRDHHWQLSPTAALDKFQTLATIDV